MYRQDNSAYVSVTSDSADLQLHLADLIRLLDESVSHITCVKIERGWLIEFRYMSPITATRLGDLGKALETTADERRDLVPLARQATDLLNAIETGKAQGDGGLDHRVRAAGLFRRRGLI